MKTFVRICALFLVLGLLLLAGGAVLGYVALHGTRVSAGVERCDTSYTGSGNKRHSTVICYGHWTVPDGSVHEGQVTGAGVGDVGRFVDATVLTDHTVLHRGIVPAVILGAMGALMTVISTLGLGRLRRVTRLRAASVPAG